MRNIITQPFKKLKEANERIYELQAYTQNLESALKAIAQAREDYFVAKRTCERIIDRIMENFGVETRDTQPSDQHRIDSVINKVDELEMELEKIKNER